MDSSAYLNQSIGSCRSPSGEFDFECDIVVPAAGAIFGNLNHLQIFRAYCASHVCNFSLRTPYLDEPKDSYWRFYADWSIQTLAAAMYYTVILTSAIFYIGMCLYVNAMVVDLKLRLQAINGSVLIGEITFHHGILE